MHDWVDVASDALAAIFRAAEGVRRVGSVGADANGFREDAKRFAEARTRAMTVKRGARGKVMIAALRRKAHRP